MFYNPIVHRRDAYSSERKKRSHTMQKFSVHSQGYACICTSTAILCQRFQNDWTCGSIISTTDNWGLKAFSIHQNTYCITARRFGRAPPIVTPFQTDQIFFIVYGPLREFGKIWNWSLTLEFGRLLSQGILDLSKITFCLFTKIPWCVR